MILGATIKEGSGSDFRKNSEKRTDLVHYIVVVNLVNFKGLIFLKMQLYEAKQLVIFNFHGFPWLILY